ncbi:hypothetical protein DFH94DRAFT_707025 [Russula ochroleuca]|uniref:Mediator of RNA polymerase II transcription subunit 11 n=1 Tax=Russula ochroleuca TaxID=152965 RepID=A0A9P5N6S2_9AGAM|nr:hypothetical protein DFH94DRAFT_707025 [Russula ochroleuca]
MSALPDYDADPIWSSSRTASQIHDLGRVEKDIGHLLSLASTSLALLSLPQTDAPDEGLPEGDERSEQFVAKVGEYFETLDGIQTSLRASLAHIRAARISPAVLTAPPAGFVPPPQGVGLPFPHPPGPADRSAGGGGSEGSHAQAKEKTRGLLEERVERDAWRGALDALTRLMEARRAAEAQPRES